MKLTSAEYKAIAEVIWEYIEAQGVIYLSDDEIKRQPLGIARALRSAPLSAAPAIFSFAPQELENIRMIAAFYSDHAEADIQEALSKTAENSSEQTKPLTWHVMLFANTVEQTKEISRNKKKLEKAVRSKLAEPPADILIVPVHLPKQPKQLDPFEIHISNRVSSLCYSNEKGVTSNVYVANLYDIVQMYNHLGIVLFNKNVRYHIADKLNVESEIKRTLQESPTDFFNRNNGIAIQIRKKDGLDKRKEASIRLSYSGKDDISIINGAQTISSAAEFFFNSPSTEAADITAAKEKACILLRVFSPDSKETSEVKAEYDCISVALNRQKPINAVDIDYMDQEVVTINELAKSQENCYAFQLTKRGQPTQGKANYGLDEFGRFVTAYYKQLPGKARSETTKNIIKHTADGIYAPLDECENPDALFKQWYRPLNFAAAIARVYPKDIPESEDSNVKAIVKNGRYFFVAYIVNILNDRAGKNSADFSSFAYNRTSIINKESLLLKSIVQYTHLLAQYAKQNYLGKDPLSSNDFKKEDLFNSWMASRISNYQVQAWENQFVQILTADAPLPAPV